MRRASKRILQKAASAGENEQTPAAYARTRRHIFRQLDALLRHQDSLADPDDQKRHHAMRIAAKRLRYTLEIARPVYAGQLEEAVGAIKKVQSLLGEVHDCDVWAEHLDAFASSEHGRITALFGHPGRFTRLQPGIDYLRQDRRRHRQEVFTQLVAYWAELGRRRFWDGLTSVVLAGGQTSAVAPSPQSTDGSALIVPTSDPTTAAPTFAVAGVFASEVTTAHSLFGPTATPASELQPARGDPETPPLDGSSRVRQATRRPLLTAGS